MLCIGIEYLTGYAVATQVSDRGKAEWPPHPARVFMALAAAWFETGRDAEEEAALRWLEALEPPAMALPAEAGSPRAVVTQYVPVNDKAGPAAATLQSAPSLTRSKQPRTTPRVFVGLDQPDDRRAVWLLWQSAEVSSCAEHDAALSRLLGKVTRIGHSSSLVHLWIEPDPPAATLVPGRSLQPVQMRVATAGTLDRLDAVFGERQRDEFLSSRDQVATTKGDAGKQARADFEQRFGLKWKKDVLPPPPIRPSVSTWVAYGRPVAPSAEPKKRQFDPDILVFRLEDGPRRGLASALAVCDGVRRMLIRQLCTLHECEADSLPAWLTGHGPDGSPDQSQNGHLAVVPLANVGHEHAEGAVLGVALVLPSAVDAQERTQWLAPLLFNAEKLESRRLDLQLGRLGGWQLARVGTDDDARWTLDPRRWGCGRGAEAARRWASVTPVVLDRFPKADRKTPTGRWQWQQEVAELIALACDRVGLPVPEVVDVDTSPWLRGSLRAVMKRRRMPGEPKGSAGLGDGFPSYPAKTAAASRPQVHVWLQFAEPITGPVLLGAGRFGGYGLFAPIHSSSQGSQP